MSTRDRAYAVVKKMKAAYSQDGCDWQTEIEKAINDALDTAAGLVSASADGQLSYAEEAGRNGDDDGAEVYEHTYGILEGVAKGIRALK